MFNRLLNWNLRHKIMGGFGLVLLLLCGVAAVSYYTLADLTTRVQQTDAVNDLVRLTLDARQQEQRYIESPGDQAAQAAAAATDRLGRQAADLEQRFEAPGRQAQMAAVAEKAGAYRRSFDTYVDLEAKRQQTMAVMQRHAAVALEKISRLRDNQTTHLQSIREHNQDFMTDKLEKAEEVNELLSLVLESKLRVVSMSAKFFESDYVNWQIEHKLVTEGAGKFHAGFEDGQEGKQGAADFLDQFKAYVEAFEQWYRTRDAETLATVFKRVQGSQMDLELLRANQVEALAFGYEETSALMDDRLAKADAAGRIITLFKDARTLEKEAILDATPESVALVTGRIDEITGQLDSLKSSLEDDREIDEIDEVAASVAAYRTAFADYMDLMRQQGVSKENMRRSAGEVESICRQALRDEKAKMDHRIAAANTVSGVFTAVAIAVGMLLAFLLANSITKALMRVISGLTNGSDQLVAAADQVSSSSQTLAQGASDQAASLEETSATLEQFSATTKQTARNAGHADELVAVTGETVAKANGSMSDLTTSIEAISEASERTQKIIKTIDEIAFQTNLLALNAAVEAARAGEAGAGFAVVAEEVRNLAMRSAEAARDTANLIEGTVRKVQSGQTLVETTSSAFQEVRQHAEKVSQLVTEISEASQQQAASVDQINSAVHEMDRVTQQNAAAAEESASASQEMNAQSETLEQLVTDLVTLVGGRAAIPLETGGAEPQYRGGKGRLRAWTRKISALALWKKRPAGNARTGGRSTEADALAEF